MREKLPFPWPPKVRDVLAATVCGAAVLVVIILVVAFVLSANSGNRPRQREPEPDHRTEEEILRPAAVVAERWVLNHLLAPSTATIHPARLHSRVRVEQFSYIFAVEVDAQNAFGAMLRKTFYVAVRRGVAIAGGESARDVRALVGW